MTDLQTFLKTLRIDDAVAQLQSAPDAVHLALVRIEDVKTSLGSAREDLKLAQANAEAQAWLALNGSAEKMLAAEKKAAIDKAVAESADVQAARDLLAGMEHEYGLAQANYEREKTRVAVGYALSELAAATLRYVAAQPRRN